MLKELQTRRADCICTWRFPLALLRRSCQRGIFIEMTVVISELHRVISLTTALEERVFFRSLLLQIDQYLTRRGVRVKISKAMCSTKIEE